MESSKVMTLTAYARRVGISQQRMSQLKSQDILDGCYTTKGRTCLINVEAADARLRSDLDPGQPARKARPPKPSKPITTGQGGTGHG